MSVKMNAVLMLMFLIISGIAAAAPVQKAGDGTGFSLLQDLVLLLSRAGQQSGTAGEWNDTILKLAKRLKAAPKMDPPSALVSASCASAPQPSTLRWT